MVKNVPVVVVFEGADKTGKSAIVSEFNKITNFKYLVFDRFLFSSLVYDKLFKRGREKYYAKLLNKMKKVKLVVVFCACESRVVRNRLAAAGETLPRELQNIDEVQKEFYNVLLKYDKFISKRITVCTTYTNAESCAELLAKKVEHFENEMMKR